MEIIKAQGLYDVADPDFDPDNGDQYDKQLFEEKESYVHSVLVTSLQTDKGRELVKEFEGDVSKDHHHYHTESNVAQHEVVTLTTYITNLSLTRQFCSHFKENLRLLASLVSDKDKIPETVRITFLQRAVPKNHDLRQIHVLDSMWRSKIPQESLLLKSSMKCLECILSTRSQQCCRAKTKESLHFPST